MFIPSSLLNELIDQAQETDLIGMQKNAQTGQWSLTLLRDQIEVGTKMINPSELTKLALEKKVWLSVPKLTKIGLSVKTIRNQQDEQRDPGIGFASVSTEGSSNDRSAPDELNRVVADASGSGVRPAVESSGEGGIAPGSDGLPSSNPQALSGTAVVEGAADESAAPVVPPVAEAITPAPSSDDTPAVAAESDPANPEVPVAFSLTKEAVAESRGLKQKAQENVLALELLSKLDREQRQATDAEKFVLARYVGWGGLSKAFRKLDGSFNEGWEDIGERIEAAVSASELKSMAMSTLDAFYTPIDVVDAMWNGVKKLGIQPRKIHEPAVGSGLFIGRSPFPARDFTAVEMETTTAKIASHLYPEARVINAPYQRVLHRTAPIYDLVIGNPPFGQDRIVDAVNPSLATQGRNTHGYFFAKSMAKTAPGGIVAMVVSRYLMDAENGQDLRAELFRQASLLGAYRLPDVAFKQNAATDVVTDVIFLQKRHEPLSDDELEYQLQTAMNFSSGEEEAGWVLTDNVDLPHVQEGRSMEVRMNRYFVERPNHVLGRLVAERGMYRDGELGVKAYPDADWLDLLNKGMEKLELASELPYIQLAAEVQPTAAVLKGFPVYDGDYRAGSFVLVEAANGEQVIGLREGFEEGGLFYEIGYRPVVVNTDERYPEPLEDEPDLFERITKMNYDRMLAYLPLRDAVMDLLQSQVELPDDERSNALLDEKRAAMSKLYDEFTKRFGLLNRPSNERAIRDDLYSSQVLALEDNYKKAISKDVAAKTGEKQRPESAEKSRIFEVRTTFPPMPEPSEAADVDSAFVLSLNYRGGVDPNYMSSILGRPWSEIRAELGDRICLLADGWKTFEQAASGDVVHKIELMNDDLLMDHVERTRSTELLRGALPPDKTIDRISVLQGANWIPLSIYEEFMEQAFGKDVIRIALDGEGKVTADRTVAGRYTGRGESGATFTTDRVKPERMASLFLLRHAPVVVDYVNEKPVVNTQQTELARARMDALISLWDKWIKQDPDRCVLLEQEFNRRFNRFAEYKGHGNLLALPDLSPTAPTPRPTQKDGAWRIINGRAVLIDHGVGAGKTITAIIGAMESKRLGLIKKAMIAVPNGLQGQWATAALTMYPNANVVVASEKDLESKNRRRFLSRIATDDRIDLIIIPQSSFSLIPRDPDFDVQIIDERIETLLISLQEEEKNGEKSKSFKQIQRKIKKERERAEKIIDRAKSDDRTIHFGMIGVDMLIIDESQNFKNISYQTSFRNVGGLGNPDGSAKADDCMIKQRMIIDRGGKVVDMSGTPEANSLAEVYLSQNKLDPGTLARMGIRTFDQWASVFARVTNEFQFTLSGGFKERAYLNSFVNLTVLQDSLLHFRHSVTIEDVKRLAVEAGLPPIPIPKLAGGKPNVVVVPQTDAQKAIIGYQVAVNQYTGDPIYNEGSILHQVANLPTGRPQKGEKNILTCIGDLNKASLAAQEYLQQDTGDRVPKLDAMTDSLVGLYSRFNENKGTQIVFLDFSTPKAKGKSKISKEAQMVIDAMRDIEIGEREEATDSQVSAREDAEEFLSGYTQTEIDDLLQDGGEWSAYVAAKAQLIEKGIPAHEIAFIHDCATSEQREELFGKMRSGEVRVIFGSTSKMGAGVNVQNRIVGMHMLDAPWRPDQMEQRIGRMLRQGNELMELLEGFEVVLNYYVTEGSSDAARYQILENKKRFLDAIRVRDGSDTVDDPEGAAFNPAAIMAAASGNEVLQDRAVFSNALKRVGSLIDAQESERYAQRSRIDRAQKRLDDYAPRAKNAELAIEYAKAIIAENNRLRLDFEDAVEALKTATAQVREEQRDFVHAEKLRILSEHGLTETHANALTKEESEQAAPLAERKEAAKAELEAQGKLWNERLIANLAALPQPGKGWIRLNVPGKGETQFNNTTLGAYAEETIKDMRRQGKREAELFENMGVKVSVRLEYSEMKGTYPVILATVGEGDEAIVAERNYLSASLSDGGLELMRVYGEIARVATDVVSEIRRCQMTLEDAKNTVVSSDNLDQQYAWLEEANASAQSLLRCSVRNWEDGVALMDRLEGFSIDKEEHPMVANMSDEALKLPMEIAAPHSLFIRNWIDERDDIMAAISSGQAVPDEAINRMVERMEQNQRALDALSS